MSGNDETIAAVIALACQYHETVVFAIMLEQVLGDGHACPLHQDDAGDAGALDGRDVGAAHLGGGIDRQPVNGFGIVMTGISLLSHDPPRVRYLMALD